MPKSPSDLIFEATLTGTNRAVVRIYNGRGTAEQWIKEGKTATHWTRLSCHRFRANEGRLLLGVIAYSRMRIPSAYIADRASGVRRIAATSAICLDGRD
jgi:hypothetical protein